MKLFEWESAPFYMSQDKMSDFVQYLNEQWQSRVRYLDHEELSESAENTLTSTQRFFQFTGDRRIIARNYVGVMQFDGIRIQVIPKLFKGSTVDQNHLMNSNLLYWLSYCRKIRFPFSVIDASLVEIDDLLEFIIYLFANRTNEVLSTHPYHAYESITEEVPFLRGRINFPAYASENIATGKWHSFQCTHSPFVFDNLFNRIVRHVCRKLVNTTCNSENKELLTSILFHLHDVSDVNVQASDCKKVVLNPLYSDLRHVLNFCEIFLKEQVSIGDFSKDQNFCFMFPMEYVFEDFIFGFLDTHSRKKPLSQSSDYLATHDKKKVFKIRNDVYFKDELIIDTKYKSRAKEANRKGGVQQSDLYQVISYAIRRGCSSAMLLYPYIDGADNSEMLLKIPEGNLSEEIEIDVKSIDITLESLKNADEVLKGRFKKVGLLMSGN
jgi:5-methylcytosine-specific restriction enzyme subunit McrC